MSLLDQVKNNEVVDLHIAAAADDVFDHVADFFEALDNNTSIETIHLEKDFIGDLRNDARSKLLYSMGQVKNLKEVTLGDGLLQINDVTKMILKARNLRSLHLHSLVLQGIASDFDACESALYQHGGMKEFEMTDCDTAISGISLEKLSKAGQKFSGGAPLGNPAELNAQSAMTA